MINQENFSREMREEGLSKRTGTNIDERQLRMELKKLGNENHVNKLRKIRKKKSKCCLMKFYPEC